MPAFTFVGYMYFKDNEEMPKSHNIVIELNKESDFTITSLLELLEKYLLSLQKMFVKNCLSCSLFKISKLSLYYQILIHGTNIVRKRKNFILEDSMMFFVEFY